MVAGVHKKTILGAAIGNCVHVAGVMHFLSLAESEGYNTIFLGPAVPIPKLISEIIKNKPDVVALSYRLTPENGKVLIQEIITGSVSLTYSPEWTFGGTKPVADIARDTNFFSFVSDGFDDINESIRYLRGSSESKSKDVVCNGIIERIKTNYPYPVIRHHFGLPSLEDTIQGIKKIADAKVLDVISLGPDQNAQQYFFHPENMREEYHGAGGVPIRTKEEFLKLKQASQTGNFPLMRCYSGTADVFQYAELLKETIDNAWTAVPLCWYNELDGRGDRSIEVSIKEAHELIKWHVKHCIPVEINEPHHWGLRDAHDVISVVMAYISAYTAKRLGVKDYIAQYMFNNPNGLSFSMDLARVLAMIEMVESLHDDTFTSYRETRAGLALFSPDLNIAKGQLAASTFMQMVVKPHIMHVVAFSEADHAASADDVIESCKIVRGVIRHTFNESYSIEINPDIVRRKEELISEAKNLISFIETEFNSYEDPLSNPNVLAECVKRGFIDATHIVKNKKFTGNLATKFVDGKCLAFDRETESLISEAERISLLLKKEKRESTQHSTI